MIAASLKRHWPEYFMEGAELAAFMISASVVVTVLEHPDSPARGFLPDAAGRRALIGIAMGLTAMAIVYSPWGRRSGAHFNPSVTLTFWRLGRVSGQDAIFYIIAQFAGAIAGMLVATAMLGGAVAHPAINYVATSPGDAGVAVAFAAEVAISFLLMSIILAVSNRPQVQAYTGVLCGVLVAAYIAIEAPFSGMSMNPARSLAPALMTQVWDGIWIYFVAPPLGMLIAAELQRRQAVASGCAKLCHCEQVRCIFCNRDGSVRREEEPWLITTTT